MLDLKQLAEKIGAKYLGSSVVFHGVSVDSRQVKKGDLFVALRAARDGHDFVKDAIAKGAACVMVDHELDLSMPQIIVQDTLKGLGELAYAWREQFNIPVIALTGTAGKTTTKEMIASILRNVAPTLATELNLNNAIGVPLTLLRLNDSYRFAVVEMGTNSPGEIAYAANITKPTVALITNVHAQHVEKLGSVDGVSREKSDIFSKLNGEGVAIVNIDDPFARSWEEKIPTQNRINFGLSLDADLRAEHIHYDFQCCEFDLISPVGVQSIKIPLGGQHIVMNALAAAAATMAVGASIAQIAQGLSQLKPVEGRFNLSHLPTGAMMIDDTYNASFKSVENAIDALKTFNGKRIFVMTNMGEMGDHAEEYHRKMGELMSSAMLDAIFLYGDASLLAPTMAACPEARYYKDKDDLVAALLPFVQAPDALLLVKGSHANKMDEVIQRLRTQVAVSSHVKVD